MPCGFLVLQFAPTLSRDFVVVVFPDYYGKFQAPVTISSEKVGFTVSVLVQEVNPVNHWLLSEQDYYRNSVSIRLQGVCRYDTIIGIGAPMDQRDKIAQLSQDLSLKMGLPPVDAVVFALKAALAFPNPGEYKPDQTPTLLLTYAEKLCAEQGGFTLDELLVAAYEQQMLLEVHSLKILAAKILRAAGYQRKQIRRGDRRPLLWFKPFVLEDAIAF